MRRLLFAPAARRDLDAIAEYLVDAAGEDVAFKAIGRISDKCDLLEQTPGELGTIRDQVRPGLRSFPVAPYVLFFRTTESSVEVIRILHERQDVDGRFRADD